MEVKTLKVTPKYIKQHTCRVELQGLPNITKKINDEKFEKQLNQSQWCGCHLQQKESNKMERM